MTISLADLFNGRGLAYYHNSQYNEAIADFKQAILLAENNGAPGNTSTAQTTTTSTSTSSLSSVSTSGSSSDKKTTDKNQQKSELSLAIYHANLGLCYFYQNDLEKAIAEISFAISSGLVDSFLLSTRGTAYQLTGKLEEAKNDRKRAHALDSTILVDIFPYPFPQELIYKIIDFLPYRTLLACKVTGKNWNKMITDRNALWGLSSANQRDANLGFY